MIWPGKKIEGHGYPQNRASYKRLVNGLGQVLNRRVSIDLSRG